MAGIGAFAEKVIVPFCKPGTVGVNRIWIVQSPAGAMVAQLSVCEKFPVVVTLETASGLVPMLVSCTLCTGLVVPTSCPVKVKLSGLRMACGAMPVPLKETTSVPASVETVMPPLRAPVVEGVNVT